MVIAVTGQQGQVGSELRALVERYPQHQFLFTDKNDLDITDKDAVFKYVQKHQFQVLINGAGYTAVDKAESEPELANAVNHLGVRYLAEACKMHGVKMVHISTDYVFDGTATKPYKETDEPNPQGVYGQSKLDGELALKTVNPQGSLIIRTAWVYSPYGHNFVKTMLRLARERGEIKVVNDQIGAPTYAADLAKAILDMIPQLGDSSVATYHYTNAGHCSWYDLAKTIFELKSVNCKVVPIKTTDYPTAAKRPKYSVLDTSKFQNTFGIHIPDWRESLDRCLEQFK